MKPIIAQIIRPKQDKHKSSIYLMETGFQVVRKRLGRIVNGFGAAVLAFDFISINV